MPDETREGKGRPAGSRVFYAPTRGSTHHLAHCIRYVISAARSISLCANDAVGAIHLVNWLLETPRSFAAWLLDGNVTPKIVSSFAAFVLPGTPPARPRPTVSADPFIRNRWLIALDVTPIASAASLCEG